MNPTLPLLKALAPWGPVFFGVCFLAPVLAALMTSAGISAPFGLSEIQLGLAVGLTWGLIAKFGGRWI